MPDFHVRPLDESTWPAFARLVERHNGIWGGCWCMAFHAEGAKRAQPENRAMKEARVRQGSTHAALVFDDDRCIGWCQFGSPEELPLIKSRRAYLQTILTPPDWRITCFFVDKAYRGRGVAILALQGALDLISVLGGGTVESYPEDVEGRSTSSLFLHNGTLAMFDRAGFVRDRSIGKNRWVVRKVLPATCG